jgi:transposase
MAKKRQCRSAEFKFRVALETLKEHKTLSQLASEYELHPTQVTQSKKQLLDGGTSLFGQQRAREQQEQTAREAALVEQIGRLKMELEWLKNSWPLRLRTSVRSSSRSMPHSAFGGNLPCSVFIVPASTISQHWRTRRTWR